MDIFNGLDEAKDQQSSRSREELVAELAADLGALAECGADLSKDARDILRAAQAMLTRSETAAHDTWNSHDWTEDFGHENGQYACTCYRCGHSFFGHKRRVECKHCAKQRRGERPRFPSGDEVKRGEG